MGSQNPDCDECMQHVARAMAEEQEAVFFDEAGMLRKAKNRYVRSRREYAAALLLAPASHPEDYAQLAERRKQLGKRLAYLKSLGDKVCASKPLLLQPMELKMRVVVPIRAERSETRAPQQTEAPQQPRPETGDWRTLAACAAIGAGAVSAGVVAGGALVAGGTAAAYSGVFASAAGAAAGAHCATREDSIGAMSRTAGGIAVRGAETVRSEPERLALKIAEGARAAASGFEEQRGLLTATLSESSVAMTKQAQAVSSRFAAGLPTVPLAGAAIEAMGSAAGAVASAAKRATSAESAKTPSRLGEVRSKSSAIGKARRAVAADAACGSRLRPHRQPDALRSARS